jgi:toxin ParE1/3/4
MTRRLIVASIASQELVDAADWYHRQQPGLEHRFLDAVDATLVSIADEPRSGADIGRNLRAELVPGFPYRIIFRVKADEIRVVAIFHTARNPRRLRPR